MNHCTPYDKSELKWRDRLSFTNFKPSRLRLRIARHRRYLLEHVALEEIHQPGDGGALQQFVASEKENAELDELCESYKVIVIREGRRGRRDAMCIEHGGREQR